jgi:hypothetical protein
MYSKIAARASARVAKSATTPFQGPGSWSCGCRGEAGGFASRTPTWRKRESKRRTGRWGPVGRHRGPARAGQSPRTVAGVAPAGECPDPSRSKRTKRTQKTTRTALGPVAGVASVVSVLFLGKVRGRPAVKSSAGRPPGKAASMETAQIGATGFEPATS